MSSYTRYLLRDADRSSIVCEALEGSTCQKCAGNIGYGEMLHVVENSTYNPRVDCDIVHTVVVCHCCYSEYHAGPKKWFNNGKM